MLRRIRPLQHCSVLSQSLGLPIEHWNKSRGGTIQDHTAFGGKTNPIFVGSWTPLKDRNKSLIELRLKYKFISLIKAFLREKTREYLHRALDGGHKNTHHPPQTDDKPTRDSQIFQIMSRKSNSKVWTS